MKRVFDIAASAVGLLALSPIILIVWYLVRRRIGSPAFFYQMRSGLHGKPFHLYKFRSMSDARDSSGGLLPDEDRLSTFGKILRSTSLDELPSLWNVLKGEMSIVGPRPLLCEYLPLYSQRQARRHEVRPGLTGWAQVNGRNTLSWEDRFEHDVWYVDNQSMMLDIKITAMTVQKVLKRSDINGADGKTMDKFRGSS